MTGTTEPPPSSLHSGGGRAMSEPVVSRKRAKPAETSMLGNDEPENSLRNISVPEVVPGMVPSSYAPISPDSPLNPGSPSMNAPLSYASILQDRKAHTAMAEKELIFAYEDCCYSPGQHGLNIKFADNVLDALNQEWKNVVIISLMGKPNSINTYDFILKGLRRKLKSHGGWKLIDLMNDYFIVKCVFDTNFNLPFNMCTVILSYIEEWSAASRKIQTFSNKQSVQLQWNKPSPCFMKVNVDGSHTTSGKTGASGVLRDCSGNWCGGFMANLGTGTTLQAEAWSMFYGMQLALRLNAQNIECESDSADLVKILNEGDIAVHPLGTVFANCRSLSANFLTCTIRHVHRECNSVADLLAKGSLANANGIIWLDHAPNYVVHDIKDDQEGVTKTIGSWPKLLIVPLAMVPRSLLFFSLCCL